LDFFRSFYEWESYSKKYVLLKMIYFGMLRSLLLFLRYSYSFHFFKYLFNLLEMSLGYASSFLQSCQEKFSSTSADVFLCIFIISWRQYILLFAWGIILTFLFNLFFTYISLSSYNIFLSLSDSHNSSIYYVVMLQLIQYFHKYKTSDVMQS